MTEVIKYDLAMPVTVRKHDVNIEALRSLLRESKSESKLTNRNISEALDRPITEVEHWFRTDACFSIPDPDIWGELKALLRIGTTEFDAPVTEFIEKPGVFEKANRFYDIDGVAPTLTVASADEKIIVEEGFVSTYKTKEDEILTNLKPFNYVSLFSGIGGFEQALNQLGGTCVMASEIDKYANQAYEVLYGHKTVGDVTKVAAEDVPDHDLLVGGFPCQAFSVAGKRLGFEEARGTLFFEIARIAKVKQPKAMLLENVKGLVGHDKGNTLDTIIQTLDEIGYTVDFEVMNSKYFGVPQNRERIFIVAVRNDLIEPSEWNVGKRSDVVAKGKRRIKELGVKTFNFDWPAQEQVTVRLRDILESDVDEKFYLSEDKTAKLVAQLEAQDKTVKDSNIIDPTAAKREGYRIYEDCSPTLTARDYKDPRMVVGIEEVGKLYENRHSSLANSILATTGVSPALDTMSGGSREPKIVEPQMLGYIDLKGHDAIKRVYDPEGVSPTLTTMGGGHREPKIAIEQFSEGEGVTCCIDANYTKGTAPGDVGKGRRTHVIEQEPKYRIRKLTPRECFRLQGFPDAEFDKLTAAGISNSQLYKCAGNAVSVPVIYSLGQKLVRYLD